ncbi:MAG: hypothetical protein ABF289_12555 [Clostridiales bacterium]
MFNKYIEAMNTIKVDEQLKRKIFDDINQIQSKKYVPFFLKIKFITAVIVCILILLTTLLLPNKPVDYTTTKFKIISYAEDGTTINIKPKVEFQLKEYSPIMSNVPGFPLKIFDTNADYIQISCSEGKFCFWSPRNSIVKNKGTQTIIKSGDTIYWSPYNTNADVEININSFKNNKISGSKKIQLKKKDSLGIYYSGILYED